MTGVNYDGQLKLSIRNCEVCCEGKQSRLTFWTIKYKSKLIVRFYTVIHTYLAGPGTMDTTIWVSKYCVQLEYVFSGMSFVYFIKTKVETIWKIQILSVSGNLEENVFTEIPEAEQ